MERIPFYVLTKENIQEVADKTGYSGAELTRMLINAHAVGWTRVKVPERWPSLDRPGFCL